MRQTSGQYINVKHIGWTLAIFLSVLLGGLTVYINPIYLIIALIGIYYIFIVFKYPMFGLIGYLVVFLMRPAEIFPPLAAVRPELIVGIVVMVAVLLHQKIKHGEIFIPNDRITISLVAIYIAISVSVLTSYSRPITFEASIGFLKIMIFYYLIISLVNTKKRFMVFMLTFLLVILYISIDGYRLFLSGDFVYTREVNRLSGGTSIADDPNSFGTTLVITIPLILALAIYSKNYLIKLGLACISIFMTMLMVLTASRSALLVFMGIVIAGILFSKHKIVNSILIIALIILGWFMLPQENRERYMTLSEIHEDINVASAGRIDIWASGIRMIYANPILGIGAGAFMWADISGEYGPRRFMQSHNLYIQIFSTMGIVGVLAWLFFIITFYKKMRWLSRIRYSSESYWINLFSKSFIIVIIGLLISGIFGHNLYRYTWYMLAGLTFAMSNICKNVYARDEE